MKRGTPEHFKTMRLATLLSAERPCDRADALGIVEALCNHFAPRSAPQGNVGRCTDREIAEGCYSTRDAGTLVRALVDAGWLDEHPTYRLLIHDWEQHADEAVRKWLIRNHLPWLTPSGPRRVRVRMASRRRLDGVRPPRAGNGKGNKSSSLVLGRGAGKPWRTLPASETLTDTRLAVGTAAGLPVDVVRREWAGFAEHEFKSPKRSVDRTWANWVEKAAAWRPAPKPSSHPAKPFPSAAVSVTPVVPSAAETKRLFETWDKKTSGGGEPQALGAILKAVTA